MLTAIGPVIAASVNTFFTENAPGTDGFQDVPNSRANFFFFSGIQGRFDFGGTMPTGKRVAEHARSDMPRRFVVGNLPEEQPQPPEPGF